MFGTASGEAANDRLLGKGVKNSRSSSAVATGSPNFREMGGFTAKGLRFTRFLVILAVGNVSSGEANANTFNAGVS